MNFYLSKYSFLPPQILEKPSDRLGISVVIPCFNETDLTQSLDALKRCQLPVCDVEIIVVINSGVEHANEIKTQNLKTKEETEDWIKNHSTDRLKFHLLFFDDLPQKHAGVGLARKIGMDEALARFDETGKDGIIVCFDADSRCEENYLVEIEKHFDKHPKTPGCSVRFEHPVSGDEFEQRVYDGIINYELHLHYYVLAMRFCKLPYSFHTIGSSMAVRSSAYQKQGGMNKRKAGEDFYFLHKIIALGNFTELKSTCVIPSPRISDRVPFGTGKAIGEWVETGVDVYKTYSFESFLKVRDFVKHLPDFYKRDQLPAGIDETAFAAFLVQENFPAVLAEIRDNSTTYESFEKRFFVWFDAFTLFKLLHFLRDHGNENTPVVDAVKLLLSWTGDPFIHHFPLDQLVHLRRRMAQ